MKESTVTPSDEATVPRQYSSRMVSSALSPYCLENSGQSPRLSMLMN